MSKTAHRMPLIDALKAIAALLVLLNHFSSYGPLAEAARDAFPAIFDGFFEYGRMAVQVFLVIAAFLLHAACPPTARHLAVSPLAADLETLSAPGHAVPRRDGLAIVAAAIADQWMDDEAIPARATLHTMAGARLAAAQPARLRGAVGRCLVCRHRFPALRA
jgi:hypothetical protein